MQAFCLGADLGGRSTTVAALGSAPDRDGLITGGASHTPSAATKSAATRIGPNDIGANGKRNRISSGINSPRGRLFHARVVRRRGAELVGKLRLAIRDRGLPILVRRRVVSCDKMKFKLAGAVIFLRGASRLSTAAAVRVGS